LYLAVAFGLTGAVEVLLHRGADVNATDHSVPVGYTNTAASACIHVSALSITCLPIECLLTMAAPCHVLSAILCGLYKIGGATFSMQALGLQNMLVQDWSALLEACADMAGMQLGSIGELRYASETRGMRQDSRIIELLLIHGADPKAASKDVSTKSLCCAYWPVRLKVEHMLRCHF